MNVFSDKTNVDAFREDIEKIKRDLDITKTDNYSIYYKFYTSEPGQTGYRFGIPLPPIFTHSAKASNALGLIDLKIYRTFPHVGGKPRPDALDSLIPPS